MALDQEAILGALRGRTPCQVQLSHGKPCDLCGVAFAEGEYFIRTPSADRPILRGHIFCVENPAGWLVEPWPDTPRQKRRDR